MPTIDGNFVIGYEITSTPDGAGFDIIVTQQRGPGAEADRGSVLRRVKLSNTPGQKQGGRQRCCNSYNAFIEHYFTR